MFVEPVTLSGTVVRLEPLEVRHAGALAQTIDDQTFRYYVVQHHPKSRSVADVEQFIRELSAPNNRIQFGVFCQNSNEMIGSTSYMDIRPEGRGLEIGMTWYRADRRGTKVNPECKLLLLQHAFETIGCLRVQLKCDATNEPSKAAIRKLGAQFEGVLRRHGIRVDGTVRDTAMFSIVDEEWPQVKTNLLRRLESLE